MYRIFCDNNLLYDPRDGEKSLATGKISLTVNSPGEFIFCLPPTHPGTSDIKKLVSIVEVYESDELIFVGRVLETESDMYHMTTYTCEGELAYLFDSIQRPKEYHGLTPRSYLQDKLAQHNSQVDEWKKIELGNVQLSDMNYDARADNQYTNTLDTIKDKLIRSNGGYIRIRREGEKKYLDYLESYGRTSNQAIRFGRNILDLTENINASDIITVLIPLGKEPDGDTEGKKLTIESVNQGKDYLENQEAIALYGRIVGTNEWQDVTVPANLKSKGEEYLNSAKNLAVTIELTAVDLHLVDVDIDRIKLGDMVRVVSPPHGLDRYMMVSKREYNLVDPSADKIVLGDTISALTEKQAALQKEVDRQQDVKYEIQALGTSVSRVSGTVSEIDGKVQVLETNYSYVPDKITQIQNALTEIQLSHKGDIDAVGLQLKEITARLDALEEGGSTS